MHTYLRKRLSTRLKFLLPISALTLIAASYNPAHADIA